jgi:DNA-3-methyladenine glycosylase II
MQAAAERHLKRRDSALAAVIRLVGPCGYSLQRDRFGMLVRSIVFQQISGAAARTILGRLTNVLPGKKVAPEGLAALTPEEFRLAGISKQKASYLQSLAALSLSGDLKLARIGKYADEEIIAQLTQVKGIGVWTAQMFLMFSLGRPDVLPWDDLGIRQAIRKLYGLAEMPTRAESERIAEPWRPYASVASWYCWRSLEVKTPDASEEWQS